MSDVASPPVVVVMGASSGVGRAIVRAFAKRRARLGMISRSIDGLDGAEADVHDAGGEALIVLADVADAEAVERAAAAIEDRFGPIDVWINCAMVTVYAPVMETTAAEYRRVTEVTYLGYVHGTQAALRRMLPRDEGLVIQIGSALAYRSIPLQSAYCAAKAAIRGFTDALRTELLHDGSRVRLTMLQLPAVNTPQSIRQRDKLARQTRPVPPMYSPESIAEMVVWAVDRAPREMLIGWPTVKAVWGQKIAPGLLDRWLGAHGYASQLSDLPNDQHGRDILFETLPGDPGAHGPYRACEHGPDLQMRLRTRLPELTAAAIVAGLSSLLVSRWRKDQ